MLLSFNCLIVSTTKNVFDIVYFSRVLRTDNPAVTLRDLDPSDRQSLDSDLEVGFDRHYQSIIFLLLPFFIKFDFLVQTIDSMMLCISFVNAMISASEFLLSFETS